MSRSRAGTRSMPIPRTTTGTDSTNATQNRRVMSRSSALGPASAVTSTGSSAIPQIGHAPGPGCRISGCIGHVYSATSVVVELGARCGARCGAVLLLMLPTYPLGVSCQESEDPSGAVVHRPEPCRSHPAAPPRWQRG